MSCTVFAVPYALAWVASMVTISAGAVITNDIENKKRAYQAAENNCDDIKIISENDYMEKSLETPFVDKNILLKTLTEHGALNINDYNNEITCNVDKYRLTFQKSENNKPYFLTISFLKEDNLEEKIQDISQEYALNVQEEAYLNIVEKLKEKNMKIENEEVLEDNSIVLTINLD